MKAEVLQQAHRLRRADDAEHRAADQADRPVIRLRRLAGGLHARDVGGEGGDRHLARLLGDRLDQRLARAAFGAGLAFHEHVGRVAHHGEDALVAQLRDLGLVEILADQRIGIDLPVAGVQDQAQRRADRQAVGLGDRVRQRHQLDLERPELARLAAAA